MDLRKKLNEVISLAEKWKTGGVLRKALNFNDLDSEKCETFLKSFESVVRTAKVFNKNDYDNWLVSYAKFKKLLNDYFNVCKVVASTLSKRIPNPVEKGSDISEEEKTSNSKLSVLKMCSDHSYFSPQIITA